MRKINKIFVFITLLSLLLLSKPDFIFSEQSQQRVKIYIFYGEGCPHCERALRFLENLPQKYPQVEIVKYEVYLHPENLELFKKFSKKYGIVPKGVPTIFINEKYFEGFGERTGKEIEEYIKELLEGENALPQPEANNKKEQVLTWTKILSLAAVDAVNPCALAVLTLILISILTANPKKRKNVLLAGFAFSIAVFLMYFLYGILIIRSLKLLSLIVAIRPYLYKILGGVAVLLGILNIKDFLRYKPGGFLTEMPMFLRPKVKKIISGIISPKGAFVLGTLVTLFLLPCTIGPYFIAGGILSTLQIIKTFPYLFVYNIVFILPMIAITLIVWAGIAKIEDISGWKERNIRYLHLVAGIIIFSLGILMILEIV